MDILRGSVLSGIAGSSLGSMDIIRGEPARKPGPGVLVNHAGKVGFCDHLIGEGTGQYLLGDLREASFEDIWNGAAYQELRRQHLGWQGGLGERFEECNWCYRNRYGDFEELTVPEYGELTISCTRTPANFHVPGRARDKHTGQVSADPRPGEPP